MHRFGSKDSFLTDFAYQATCTSSLQQIGEVVKVNRSWLKAENPDFPWSEYMRFRDFSAHDYIKSKFLMWVFQPPSKRENPD